MKTTFSTMLNSVHTKGYVSIWMRVDCHTDCVGVNF
jgi:hypothetical protein